MEEDVRESELDFHIQKIKDLGFWDQIKVDTSHRDDEEDLEEFPQSPNVFHFHPYAFILQMNRMLEDVCPFCGKKHIDIANPQFWETQTPGQCWQHSVNMLNKYGVKGGLKTDAIIVATQKVDNTDKIASSLIPVDVHEGVKYILQQLLNQRPVVIGVDRNNQLHTYNSDKTTEHFVLIVGYGCENGKKYFRYFDSGSKEVVNGANINNRLFLKDNFITGYAPNSNETIYTIAQVRKNVEI